MGSKDSFHVGDHYQTIQGSGLPDLSQTTQGSELPDLELRPSALPCIHEMSKQSTFECICAKFANHSTFDAATQLCQNHTCAIAAGTRLSSAHSIYCFPFLANQSNSTNSIDLYSIIILPRQWAMYRKMPSRILRRRKTGG